MQPRRPNGAGKAAWQAKTHRNRDYDEHGHRNRYGDQRAHRNCQPDRHPDHYADGYPYDTTQLHGNVAAGFAAPKRGDLRLTGEALIMGATHRQHYGEYARAHRLTGRKRWAMGA